MLRRIFKLLPTQWAQWLKNRILLPLTYRRTIQNSVRKNNIYTQFNRFPSQYKVINEQVIPALLKKKSTSRLRIIMFGCCNGAEAYSLSYSLRSNHPNLDFSIEAYDIVEDLIEEARSGEYSAAQVRGSRFMTSQAIDDMFEMDGDKLTVTPFIAAPITFEAQDITNNQFLSDLPQADMIFAQNILFHLPRDKAEDAFRNLVNCLAQPGYLFVNGMDTDIRIKLSKELDLEPVTALLEEIHEEARLDRGEDWAYFYWGREPFNPKAKDASRQFGTIFTQKEAS